MFVVTLHHETINTHTKSFFPGPVARKAQGSRGHGYLPELHPHHTDAHRQAPAGHQPQGPRAGHRSKPAPDVRLHTQRQGHGRSRPTLRRLHRQGGGIHELPTRTDGRTRLHRPRKGSHPVPRHTEAVPIL